jgi:hypothetical protein
MGINMHNELEALGGVETPTSTDFWSWVKKTFTPSYQDEIEHYLKQSADVFDLEFRMKMLARRGMI